MGVSGPNGEYISEFNPVEGFLENNQFFKLYDDIKSKMDRSQFIGGISILSSTGESPLLIAKNKRIVEDYAVVKNIVASMQPKQFFNALSNIVERESLGHLEFDYFEIFFVKLYDDFALSFFILDEAEDLILKLNSCLSSFQHVISENLPKILEDPKKEPMTKEELHQDLKQRLSKL